MVSAVDDSPSSGSRRKEGGDGEASSQNVTQRFRFSSRWIQIFLGVKVEEMSVRRKDFSVLEVMVSHGDRFVANAVTRVMGIESEGPLECCVYKRDVHDSCSTPVCEQLLSTRIGFGEHMKYLGFSLKFFRNIAGWRVD
jgi:hypothetical protein